MAPPRSEPLPMTLADYFGLMAYLFVMHGGVPEDAPVLLQEYRTTRAPAAKRPRTRRPGRLRVIEGGRPRETRFAARARRAGQSADANENAA